HRCVELRARSRPRCDGAARPGQLGKCPRTPSQVIRVPLRFTETPSTPCSARSLAPHTTRFATKRTVWFFWRSTVRFRDLICELRTDCPCQSPTAGRESPKLQ